MLTCVAIAIGYSLDLLIGDPHSLPHPVRLIGSMISHIESTLRRRCHSSTDELRAGRFMWVCVVVAALVAPAAILLIAYRINVILGVTAESIMCYYILATKSLRDESMKVYDALQVGDVASARHHLSWIVGRDTDMLDEAGVAKAAVETVAENTSDGVIAPLMYMLIGGAPLGFMYKAVNTLDSMVGYKNERYVNIGRFSAIADDAFNFVPARLSAWVMIAAAAVTGMDWHQAVKIYHRDRYNHLSPNSAHTEAVCAGALGVRLAGGSYYGGKYVDKPTIGDDTRPVEAEDIQRANRLMYVTSIIWVVAGLAIRLLIAS